MFRPIALYTCLLSSPAFADADPPRPFPEGPVQISGPAEVVFDWTIDRCNDRHFADLPVRAFRDDGAVTLILPHDASHRMRGPDFDNLHADCAVLLASTIDQHPDQFANYEWIAASFLQGDTVHALIHNEYQGNRYLGCDTYDYFSCWYNTITYARSDDGGATFGHPIAPPAHLVASIPEQYAPDEGIFGAFSPSNIIEHDGFFYAFIKMQTYPLGSQHTCLMRTATLGDPDSWRYFDGAGFTGVFADPYRDDLRALRATTCTPLALPEIAQMYESVTWNTALQRFILIGTSSDPSRDPNPYGFYYALSEDLITWQRRTPLLEVRLPWRATGRETVYLYPALIDHGSESVNYETTGADAYLYFTRLNFGSGDLDRDLLRMPVTIMPSE
ncbi:hypothetical protein KUL25_11435 [Rhodobacteraceae bacterium N5(2021)]|uniref:Uncharacterized protein n=1 Tax=Gymnodinialimonas phycosphaerae TaxID=2841589 RepID=A0A975YEA4_9RHOB|nr:hypothetical protein [Gymnodinialimonas phycosphaerae]MBY4893376.1 hypothetical protein [Gymnodinialimonas phycosphaerae]